MTPVLTYCKIGECIAVGGYCLESEGHWVGLQFPYRTDSMGSDGIEFPSGDRNHIGDTNWGLSGQKFG